MTTSAAAAPAVRAALTQFVDYAGLFPPAKLDMEPALREYAAHRGGAYSWMLGRFIVPASRTAELLECLPPGERLALSVIVDGATDARMWLASVQATLARIAQLRSDEPRVHVEALETALPALPAQRETYDAAIGQFAAALKQSGLHELPAFVELPRDERWKSELDSALFALARHRLCAKVRCGGVSAPAFPSIEELAAFLWTAIREHRLPVKATAGLHHPVRHHDDGIGVMVHGFLNVLTAAAFAQEGAEQPEIARVLACEDARAFGFDERGLRWEGQSIAVEALRATREQAFVSYGSCSFDEPVADLQGLGIL